MSRRKRIYSENITLHTHTHTHRREGKMIRKKERNSLRRKGESVPKIRVNDSTGYIVPYRVYVEVFLYLCCWFVSTALYCLCFQHLFCCVPSIRHVWIHSVGSFRTRLIHCARQDGETMRLKGLNRSQFVSLPPSERETLTALPSFCQSAQEMDGRRSIFACRDTKDTLTMSPSQIQRWPTRIDSLWHESPRH